MAAAQKKSSSRAGYITRILLWASVVVLDIHGLISRRSRIDGLQEFVGLLSAVVACMLIFREIRGLLEEPQ